jgi:hypothetical protein
MTKYTAPIAIFAFTALLICLLGYRGGIIAHTYNVDAIYRANQSIINDLIRSYDVNLGVFHIIEEEVCIHSKESGCLFNNQITPYGFIFVNEPYDSKISKQYRFIVKNRETKYVPKWNLDANEAIIFGGKAPPNMRYYSFQNYLMERYNFGFLRFVFGSLGNSINNFRINVTADGQFIAVASPNRIVQDNIIHTLSKHFPGSNLLPFPYSVGSKVRYGHAGEPDLFSIMARFAMPDNETEWLAYKKSTPIWVYKLKFRDLGYFKNLEHFGNPKPDLITAKTNFNEGKLVGEVGMLREGIINVHAGKRSIYESYLSKSALDILNIRSGGDCISEWFSINCFGEIRDTVYALTLPSFNLKKGEIFYVYGVNHRMLNNTAYTGIIMYDTTTMTALGSVNDMKLRGTANEYLGYEADYLYVHKFMYDCPEDSSDCTAIKSIKDLNIKEGDTLNILGRDYNDIQFNISNVLLPRYIIVTDGRMPYRPSMVVIASIIYGNFKAILISISIILGVPLLLLSLNYSVG